MMVNWVKYKKLHRRYELIAAIAYTILVAVMSAYHIYGLAVPSALV